MRPGQHSTTATRDNLPALVLSVIVISVLLVLMMSLLEMAGAGFEPRGSPTLPTTTQLLHFGAISVVVGVLANLAVKLSRR